MCVHWCNGHATAMVATNIFLTGFKDWFTGGIVFWFYYPAQKPVAREVIFSGEADAIISLKAMICPSSL